MTSVSIHQSMGVANASLLSLSDAKTLVRMVCLGTPDFWDNVFRLPLWGVHLRWQETMPNTKQMLCPLVRQQHFVLWRVCVHKGYWPGPGLWNRLCLLHCIPFPVQFENVGQTSTYKNICKPNHVVELSCGGEFSTMIQSCLGNAGTLSTVALVSWVARSLWLQWL